MFCNNEPRIGTHNCTVRTMTGRERFLNVMEYKPVDRIPNVEVGVWGQTRQRWLDEGLDPDKVKWDWWTGEEFFGIDPREYINIDFGMIPQFKREIIEKADRYEIYRDNKGILHKAMTEGVIFGTRPSMDQYLDFPVKDRKDFTEIRKRYRADAARYPADWEEKLLPRWQSCDIPLIFGRNCSTLGFYWRAREWMGTENLSYAFYDQPELIHEMMEFIADFTIEVSKPVLAKVHAKGIQVDYVMINEDMSMKAGPLIGPPQYKEFIFPHMRRLADFYTANGVRYVMVDTDGNCDALIPLLMECGTDGLWPLERVAGMDPVILRKKYGRDLRLYGGVDKMRIAQGREEIDRHLAELLPLIEEGGFIPTIDHTVSPDISLNDFTYYMERKSDLLTGKF